MKIPKGKRAPETSVESQVYIDTGKLPKAHALRLWGYRVLEDDDEGDPLDHGSVRASTLDEAVALVGERLDSLGNTSGDVEVRFYPTQDRTTPGVLESDGDYTDVTVPATICECGRYLGECATADDEDADHGDR